MPSGKLTGATNPVSDTSSYLRENPAAHTEFLVDKAKGGSEAAWRELYTRYRKMLVTNVQARIPGFARRHFDAEDVLQAAVMKAWQRIESFQYQGEGSFRRWLTTLVLNEFQNELRGKHRDNPLSLDAAAAPSELDRRAVQDNGLSDAKTGLLEALGQIQDEDRDILIQRVFEERSFDAIAASLECPREKVRQLYALAVQRLQRELRR